MQKNEVHAIGQGRQTNYRPVGGPDREANTSGMGWYIGRGCVGDCQGVGNVWRSELLFFIWI